MIISALITIILILIALVYQTNFDNSFRTNFDFLKDYLKNSSTMWFAFLFNVFSTSLVGYFIDVYLEKYLFPSLMDEFALKNKGFLY